MRILYKKRLSIILVMFMVLSGMNGLLIGDDRAYAIGVAFAGGDGSSEHPYQIATPDQLNEVRNHVEAGIYFKLTADIDLSEYPADDDAGWLPIGNNGLFSGNFDGNGFKIMNLMINRPANNYIGLFKANNGTITNLTLENIDVTGKGAIGGLAGDNFGSINNTTVTGSVYALEGDIGGLLGYNSSEISNSSSAASVHGIDPNVGGLVGANWTSDAESPATISNSFATGDVRGDGGYVGGLVGLSLMEGDPPEPVGSIKNSYATGNVNGGFRMGGLVGDNRLPIHNSYATGTVTGDDNDGHEIGGLAGYNKSEISNSYARGTLNGTSQVGGLVGSNVEVGSVSNSYATGSVNGTTNVGSLIGQKGGAGLISGSFYNSETLPLQVDNGLGIGKTISEMQLDSTYIGWSFADIWEINASINSGYPYLKSLPSSTIAGVIAPVAGSIPIDSIVETTSYTAAITWSPEDVPFAAGTVYTAEIVISPKTGYTLTGVTANFFKVAGATTTNSTNSGVVTAEFPAAAPSSAATLTSTIGTVSMGGTANETITNIPYGTTLVALMGAITPAANATVTVYDGDGTTEASTLTTGKKVVVTAQDGITKVTYTVSVESAPSNNGGDSPTPPSTNNSFTSTDGTLTLPAGRAGEVSLEGEVTVTIPADATNKELRLTIEKVLNTQSLFTNQEVLIGSVYEILKNFPENFKRSVTLTFIFDSASLKSNQKVFVFYYDEVNKIWVKVGGVVSGNKITVDVDHFTKYAVMVVDGANEPATDTPTDFSLSDISGHWAETYIKQAAIEGIVNGYPDGTFKPNHIVTRAEFTVMLMNALKHQEAGKELIFTDKAMIGAWAQKAVEQAIQAGITNGYLDGTFRPSAEITRAEMAKMIAVSIGQATELHANETNFADNEDIPVWAKGSIAYLRDEGIMQGRGNNVFAPQDHATRAEAVTVLLNILAKER